MMLLAGARIHRLLGNSASLGPGLPYPGPCILFAVVKSAGWARQTDLGPGPSTRPRRSRLVLAPLPFRTKREPEQLPGPLRPKKTRGARICKEGPPTAKEEQALGPHNECGAAFRGGGRLQGSPGRLPAMERSRKPPKGGSLLRRLRRQRGRRPALSPP